MLSFAEYCKLVSPIELTESQLSLLQKFEDAHNNNQVLIIGGLRNGKTQSIKWWIGYLEQILENSKH